MVNDISRQGIGFDTPDNEVTIVLAAGERPVPKAAKAEVAAAIVDVIEDLRAGRHTGGAGFAPPHGGKGRDMSDDREEYEVYDLFTRGTELLESGDFNAAAVPLERAPPPGAGQGLDPRGARPRLLPIGPLRQGREEFAAVVERYPTNDFALFCLGRACELTGDRRGPAST